MLNCKPAQAFSWADWLTRDCACAGTSTAWLFPFVDGHPPIGWGDASKYLVLPVLLVSSKALHMLSVPMGRRSFHCRIKLPPCRASFVQQPCGLDMIMSEFDTTYPAVPDKFAGLKHMPRKGGMLSL